MNREELIDKAAKAILARSWGLGTLEGARGDAEAALAVFEQANTPTEDERKIAAQVMLPVFDQLAAAVHHEGPYSEAEAALDAADLLVAAGFRRTVQGEPTGAPDLSRQAVALDRIITRDTPPVVFECPNCLIHVTPPAPDSENGSAER